MNTLLVEQAKTALASPLWNFDQTQIADAAASIMKTRAAYAVVIRQQKTGEIIYALVRDRQWKTVPMGKEVMSTEGLLSGESPIVYSSQTIGSVQVYVTQTFLKAKLAKIQMAFILCFLIVLAMLITVLYFLLRYIILRPVQLLAEYSQTVKSGKGDTALIPTG